MAYAGLADALQCHWPAAQFTKFSTPAVEIKSLNTASIWTVLEAFWESENQQNGLVCLGLTRLDLLDTFWESKQRFG